MTGDDARAGRSLELSSVSSGTSSVFPNQLKRTRNPFPDKRLLLPLRPPRKRESPIMAPRGKYVYPLHRHDRLRTTARADRARPARCDGARVAASPTSGYDHTGEEAGFRLPTSSAHGTRPFADRLDALRSAAGLSYRQLASASGLKQGTVSRLLTGRMENPPLRTLLALQRGLGLGSIEELLGPLPSQAFGPPPPRAKPTE